MSDTVQQVDALRVGVALEQDIFDAQGVLLLRSGTVVTNAFIERLKARGIKKVSTSAEGITEADSPASGKQPPKPRGKQSERGQPGRASQNSVRQCGSGRISRAQGTATTDPLAYQIHADAGRGLPRLSAEAFEAAAGQAERAMTGALERWEELGGQLIKGRPFDAGQAEQMLDGMMPMLVSDRDVVGVMLHLHTDHLHPTMRHGVRVALMAMHLARHVGYADAHCLDAGMVGLFADVGMSRIPAEIVNAERPLTPDEWFQVHRHPAYSADLLEAVPGLRPDIAVAVYQHHERLDGSGYPHGRKGMFLHPMARIVAIADIFAAVSDARAYRPARGGPFAVRAVLEGVKAGQLDRVVAKALVDSVSLFPLGTRLTLSDQRRGEVYRTNPDHADRPVLTLLDGDNRPTKRKLDLAFADDLRVASVDDAPLPRAA